MFLYHNYTKKEDSIKMSASHLSAVFLNTIQQNEYSGFLNFLRNRDYIIGQDSYCQFINEKKPVVAFDVTFKILYVNDLMKTLLGSDDGSVYGKLLQQVFPICINPEHDYKVLSPWGELIRNGLLIGKKYNGRLEFMNRNPVAVSMTGSPLFDKSGQLAGGVVFFQTDKSELEK
jgi:PAS domain-containing protein